MAIMIIYNSITDIDLQLNNGHSKFTIMYGYPRFNYGYPELYAGKTSLISITEFWMWIYNSIMDIHNCGGSYILKLYCGCPIIGLWIRIKIELWIFIIRHHYTYTWLSIIGLWISITEANETHESYLMRCLFSCLIGNTVPSVWKNKAMLIRNCVLLIYFDVIQ